jgi:hypothetical protein
MTDNQIIDRYYNGEKLIDIFPNNGINKLYRTLKKYNLPKRIPCNAFYNTTGILKYNKQKRKDNILKYGIKEIIKTDSLEKYKVKCPKCNNYHFVQFNRIKKMSMCIQCCNRDKSNIACRSKKRADNTSGFTGVALVNGKNIGVKVEIKHHGLRVFTHFYKDEFIYEKTIIQGAIDREIFIIEHKLPHRRNFTDLELFANMEYLAYDNINTLKEKLQQN